MKYDDEDLEKVEKYIEDLDASALFLIENERFLNLTIEERAMFDRMLNLVTQKVDEMKEETSIKGLKKHIYLKKLLKKSDE